MTFNHYNSKIIKTPLIKEEYIIPKEKRETREILTKYEYTEAISIRAKDIEKECLVFTNIEGEIDPIKIAKKEIKDKKCPLSIKRTLSDGNVEIWDINELIYLKK